MQADKDKVKRPYSYYWKKLRYWKWIIILMVVAFFVLIDCGMTVLRTPEEIPYTQYLEDLEAGKIDCVYYTPSGETMRYTVFNKETEDMSIADRSEYEYDAKYWRLTVYPGGETFRQDLVDKGVRVVIKSWTPISIRIISTGGMIAFVAIMVYMLYRMSNMGSVQEETFVSNKNIETTFKDVIGHDEIKEELQFIVNFMRNPIAGNRLGAVIPKGLLFTGPPGTGKTLLARAVAGESDVPFYYINASAFIEMYAGTGAKRVRNLFKEARKTSPCIVFIDEIDAIGGSRDKKEMSSSEDRQTLNALLQEMDGFKKANDILIIAATNCPDHLDKALTRSGRFDRQIVMSPPGKWEVRRDLLKYYLKNKSSSETIDIDSIAKSTSGFTGADICAITNEAALIALSNDHLTISTNDLESAIDKRILKGSRSKDKHSGLKAAIVRYHEAGHAVMHHLLGMPIARISVMGTTSGIGGMVIGEDRDEMETKKSLEDQICIFYGGRVAEEIKFGKDNITIGAYNDIQQATNLLKRYVSMFGFDENLGALVDWSMMQTNSTSHEVTKSVRNKSIVLANKTRELLTINYRMVEELAQALEFSETLTAKEVEEILLSVVIEEPSSNDDNNDNDEDLYSNY